MRKVNRKRYIYNREIYERKRKKNYSGAIRSADKTKKNMNT